MRLNWLGRAAMNNPARGRLQQEYVGKWFERLGGRVDAGRVLEVGCGQGAGIECSAAASARRASWLSTSMSG
jgi:hypothetical protein